jgi:tetratricopeptide (TPR) repeat protein
MKNRCLVLVLGFVAGLWSAEAAPLNPVFPKVFAPLVYVEGEDAVATNFTQQATIDYGSSGSRMIQLNKGPDAPGAPFFAEYVLTVDEAGSYELWLGGTPVGSKSPLSPSYASPVTVTIDDGTPFTLYREEVNVVAQYSLVNYWSKAKNLVPLTAGSHTVRFTVSEHRRYDNNSYFSLDAFFFLKDGANPPADVVPDRFPANRSNRSLDNYYLTVDQYDYLVTSKPKELSNYLELAKVYSMVGDYQNALKTLDRARVNVGESPDITLMMAKNRVWSGDWAEGLELYKAYLKSTPNDLATWSELAKVLAWQGQYTSSVETYRAALAQFPGNLNLAVNEGLTYLWANRTQEGEALLSQAWGLAQKDPDQVAALAAIYAANGYPDKAAETYERGMALFPDHLDLYLKLEESWLNQAQQARARAVAQRITETFVSSDRLTAAQAALERKTSLKAAALAGYEEKLKANPDDVKLRQQLVQAYYWNGAKAQAVAETRHILVNKLYGQFANLDKELEPTYRVLDQIAALRGQLAKNGPQAAALGQRLSSALDRWKAADGSKTHEGLAEAQKALAQAVDEANDYLVVVQKVAAWSEGIPAQAAPELAKVDGDQKTLDGYRPWSWDRNAEFDELNQASKDGLVLADALVARLELNEQNLGAARVPLGKLAAQDQPLAGVRTLGLQGTLWTTGSVDPEALKTGPYFGHAAELANQLAALTAPPAPQDFTDQTPTQAADLVKRLDAAAEAQASDRQKLLTPWSQLLNRVMVRTQVEFYRYDLDTLELRYQLGSYLIDVNQYDDARVQLGRALAISPQNVYIQFDLGRARQLGGDWSGAMALYRSIYETNPKFEFTASSYNQLAKLHEDAVSTRATSFVDNARDTTQATLNYHFSGTSLFSFDASYALDNIRLYQQSSTVVVPGSIQLQTATVKPQLTLGFLNLAVFGLAGGSFHDTLLSSSVPSTKQVDWADPLTKYLGISPVLGAGARWAWGPVDWSASYTFDQVKDTFLVGRNAAFEGAAASTLSLYFPLPPAWWVKAVGSRTSVQWTEVTGTGASNHLYSAVQEVSGVVSLAAQPATTLTASSLASWENSDDPTVTGYYAPNQVLVWKTSGQVDTQLALGGTWNLGLSGRLGGGLYADTSGQNLLTDGQLTVRATSGDLAIDLGLAASRAAKGGEVAYWSTQGQLGVTVGLPSYIIR